MDAKRRLLRERWSKRELNYQQDLIYWKKIKHTFDNKSKIVLKYDKDEFKCRYEEINGTKYKNNKVLADRCESYAARIFRVHAPLFGITEEKEVTPEMIVELVSMYLELPKHIQLNVCRDPSRQSFDEEIQINMLKENLDNFLIDKITNGKITVSNGIMTSNIKNIPAEQSSRSVDVKILSPNKNEYFGFIKYSNPIGSVTSSLQPGEGFSFLKECMKYVENNENPNNHLFFLQVDGIAGEKEIPKMLKFVENYKKIYVGNTPTIIDWIKKNEI